VTRVKIVPSVADDLSLAEAERVRGRTFAAALSMRVLSRSWQMLLKGIAEVQAAGRPVAAAEMVLVRIAYAADLPTPDEVVRSMGNGSAAAAPARPQGNGGGGAMPNATSAAAPRFDAPRGAPRAGASPAMNPVAQLADNAPEPAALRIGHFEELVALATEKRDLQIKAALERDVRLVHCEDGKLEIALEPGANKTLVNELSRKLSGWTGRQWMVIVSREAGTSTLRAQAEAQDAERKRGVRADPLVQAVLDRFPGAEIVAVRGDVETKSAGDDEAAPIPDSEND
jgi:DNA polymerase-3 subunit gamma/tau